MRRILALLLLAVLLAPASVEAKGGMLCLPFSRNYARLADLPSDAAPALGFPIAERGAPWNATDAVAPGRLLPFARFISAQGGGCTINIRYEYGGIAHGFATAILLRTAQGWTLRRRR